ncbi:MAG TPA: M28 family metallopeptidase [Gaiellaceae bacterium]|nr:M28 family metallopeptidase [Gaiellaceae bacterium]
MKNLGQGLRRVRVRSLLLIAVLATAVLLPATPAAAGNDQACENRSNNTYRKVLECVTLEGVREHQAAFQAIADANGGTRAAGTPGYTGSVEYVVSRLEAAGWDVTLNEFPFTYLPPPTLQQLTPVNAMYATGAYTGSGTGTVQGNVIPVDINLVPPRASTSGCEATDFNGINWGGPNDIALIQRGTCSFGIKAINAQNAGAEAVIIFNQGDTPLREGLIVGTLLPDGAGVVIPVVGGSFANGEALSQPGSTARIQVDPAESRPQVNVIAEKKSTRPLGKGNVVMAGAHLDSVQAGPGIQDNGSGSAALIEVAEQLARVNPANTLRFAWWGAEEAGLIGSTAYVNGLSQEEKDEIALYLNFDMIGSPNYIFMTYDGDESGFPAPPGVPIPDGSIQIEKTFESFYTLAGEPYDDAQFSGRSDYQAFILNDIPAGGLFTGAEVPKTPEQAAIWGGTAGQQYDPCYHLACDTYDNISLHALDVNSDAVAFAVMTYMYSTQSINGVKGKQVPGGFDIPAPAGPEGTVNVGGGLAHDPDE